MECQPEHALEILRRTPATLQALLRGLDDTWIRVKVSNETWSAYDVVGHLIHGEETDWLPRAKIILSYGPSQPFESFDRSAQFAHSDGQALTALLDKFADLRRRNLDELEHLNLTARQWELTGLHPELGEVTLRQLLAAWVVHDLDHVGQIVSVMAKQYQEAVGPWKAYLAILGS